MRSRRALLLAGLVAAALGPGLWYVRSRLAPPPVLRFAWAEGTRYVYAVSWSSEQEQSLPLAGDARGPVVSGTTRLEADLTLSYRGRQGERYLLGVALEEIREASTELQGQLAIDLERSRDVLLGQEALLVVDRAGSIEAVHFPAGASEHFQNAVQMLASELQVGLPGAPQREWQVEETGYLGQAIASYRQEGRSGDVVRVKKTRAPYRSFKSLPWPIAELAQDLSSSATVELHTAGYVEAITLEEAVAVDHASLGRLLRSKLVASMRLLRREAEERPLLDAAAALAAYRRRPLGAIADSDAAMQNALEHQAGRLTWADVEGRILGLAVAGPRPDQRRFIWQATGLLELHPELCAKLPALFASPRLDAAARGFVLDLLAHVGHEAAQRALVAILDSRKARESERDYIRFVQRVSFVRKPTAETARFIEAQYRNAEGHVRIAAAYSLGSTVGHLGRSGEVELARQMNQRLLDELAGAGSEDDRAMLLNALGNAGQSANVASIGAFAADPSPKVREAVGRALWKTPGDDSARVLLALTSDPQLRVQAAALRVLARFPDGDACFDALSEQILSGRISPDNFHVLLLVVGKVQAPTVRREVLDYLLAHAPADTGLKSELRSLREQT